MKPSGRPRALVAATPAPAQSALQVLALLDDAGAGAALLEISSTLARALRRDLSVVYVESARSLVAAALPFTQVLPPAGMQWLPLQPGDVEQGFRAHTARLRDMAARFALRDAVNWSLRVMRGSLSDVALDLSAESDLLLLANSPAQASAGFGPPRHTRRRPRVTVLGNGDEASQRALHTATQLADALAGVVEITRVDARSRLVDQPGMLNTLARSDVLVLPRAPLDAQLLGLLRCPVLLVG